MSSMYNEPYMHNIWAFVRKKPHFFHARYYYQEKICEQTLTITFILQQHTTHMENY